MGAEQFNVTAEGKTANEAFNNAVKQAQYEYGHRGYTGSLAEKNTFVLIKDTPAKVAERVAASTHVPAYILDALQRGDKDAIPSALLALGDDRIDAKWGPAGCVEVSPGRFAFFGWASS